MDPVTPSHPKGERQSRDLYITPDGVVEPLLAELERACRFSGWLHPRILDPGAGTGVLTRAIRKQWPNASITAVELNPEHEDALLPVADEVVIADFLTYEPDREGFDLIIGNPPFSLALPFLERALALEGSAPWAPRPRVAFLANFNFLGSDDRVDTFIERLDALHTSQRTLAPRPSFIGGGADSTEYAWQLWNAPEVGPAFGHYLWRTTDKRAKRALESAL